MSDCPDGEDEDSKLWDLSPDRRFSNQTKSWSLLQKRQFSHTSHDSSIIILVLLVISVVIAIILALVMASFPLTFSAFKFVTLSGTS